MDWRRKWQPTPVFLPGESQGWDCRLWWAAIYRVAQSRTRLKWLSSSSIKDQKIQQVQVEVCFSLVWKSGRQARLKRKALRSGLSVWLLPCVRPLWFTLTHAPRCPFQLQPSHLHSSQWEGGREIEEGHGFSCCEALPRVVHYTPLHTTFIISCGQSLVHVATLGSR